MIYVLLFLVLGITSRLIPHPHNFTPLASIALICGLYCRKKHAYLLPLAIFVISDLLIGLHNTVLFTWGSVALIFAIGAYCKKFQSNLAKLSAVLVSTLSFFVITNFGVWLMGWYPPTFDGFIQCYINALPFLRVSLLANCFYAGVFFLLLEPRLAKAPGLKPAA